MSAANDLVILNQAKALEGMRQRLKSRMMKLTELNLQRDRMEAMIALRDDKICNLKNTNFLLREELKKVLADRPEGYDSELTRKCQELENAKEIITFLKGILRGIMEM